MIQLSIDRKRPEEGTRANPAAAGELYSIYSEMSILRSRPTMENSLQMGSEHSHSVPSPESLMMLCGEFREANERDIICCRDRR